MAAPLPLEEAQARLLDLAEPLPLERVDPPSAQGRWLAEPLVAARTQPACDMSAMDGYAVADNDLAGPWQVIGESAAGHPYSGFVEPGQAVRISTGAVIPDGAGAVVVQEDVSRAEDHLTLTGDGPGKPGKHIRRAGSDFSEGKVLAELGGRISP
ncbi:MAG: molybdopterin molybdenumtransferase MoeA, partial [Novosphingobium sp.]